MILKTRIAFILAALIAAAANAQLNRSAVSVTGIDTNPCTPAAPCRSLAQALSQTNAGGELIVITSGGYGPVTVDRSVSIVAAPGVYAGITAPASANGITIAPASPVKVVLRGLTIEGLGYGSRGISFLSGGGRMSVENCVINSFRVRGIDTTYDAIITDTIIRSGTTNGDGNQAAVAVTSPATAVLNNVRMIDSITNLSIYGSTVTVRNSLGVRSLNYGFAVSEGGVLNIDRSTATENGGAGILVSGTGTVGRMSDCVLTDNNRGLLSNWGATTETYQTNKIRGNTTADLDNTFPVTGTITPVSRN